MDMPQLEGACEPAQHCQEADTQDDIQEVVGTHGCVGGASKAEVLIPELLLLLLHDVDEGHFNCRSNGDENSVIHRWVGLRSSSVQEG